MWGLLGRSIYIQVARMPRLTQEQYWGVVGGVLGYRGVGCLLFFYYFLYFPKGGGGPLILLQGLNYGSLLVGAKAWPLAWLVRLLMELGHTVARDFKIH